MRASFEAHPDHAVVKTVDEDGCLRYVFPRQPTTTPSCAGRVMARSSVLMRTLSLLACSFYREDHLDGEERTLAAPRSLGGSPISRLAMWVSRLRRQGDHLARWPGHARARMSPGSHRRFVEPPERR